MDRSNPALPSPLVWRAVPKDGEAQPTPNEESALLRRAQAGDPDAFAAIVNKYWRKAFWTAYDVLYDQDRAQDVAQEAFVKIHRALSTYDLDRDFASWLHRIALNLAIDHKRRRARDRAFATDKVEELFDARKSTDSDAEKRATIERVESVLATMPEKYRIPMTMKDIDGLSVEEIARILDLSYSTIRWRLHKARTQFRDRYQRLLRKELRGSSR